MEAMSLENSEVKCSQLKFRYQIAWLVFILLLMLTITIMVPVNSPAASSRQQNQAPVAEIDSPENAAMYDMNEVVHFDASSSSDPDNDTLTYQWNFGDGESDSGVKTSHVYTTPWVPIITLEVSDGELNDTARIVIIIGTGGGMNRPPTANITSPQNGDYFSVDENIDFDGSASSDQDEDAISFLWDFGDGNTSIEMVTTHSYAEARDFRPYTVALTVSDGLFNDTERVNIFVNNTPPTADAGEDQVGYPGLELFFDGSNSSDPDQDQRGGIVNYTWNMDDKTIKYGVSISHRFGDYGSYDVTLTVTDDRGVSSSDIAEVTITNAKPYAVLKVNTEDTVIETEIEFIASDSYDIDGVIEEFQYDFGDGSTTDWIYDYFVTHYYYSIGTFQVALKVRDDFGDVSEPYNLAITITEKVNQPPSVSITYPKDFDSVAGSITIQGTASDDEKQIEQVSVKIDDGNWKETAVGAIKGETANWELNWDTEEENDGSHVITARAWDGNKYSNEQSVMVNVNNRPTTFIELTETLNPSTCTPGEKVIVSGSALYDTDVPVNDADVEITITETQKVWSTTTNELGEYSYEILAPSEPGRYTIEVYTTDGTLERETSKTLTVYTPPDLKILPENIIFSKDNPVENEKVKISVTVHNDGELEASATITIYLDSISRSNILESQSKTIPSKKSTLITLTWNAKVGTHEFIVLISDTSPAENDLTNNQASKSITVVPEGTESEAKANESLADKFNKLPPMIRYSIIGGIIGVILILIIAIALKNRASTKKEKGKAAGDGKEQAGMVVFKPLDKEPPVKKSKRSVVAIVVMIFAILGIIMMGMAFIMPWYSERGEAFVGDEKFEMEDKYYLTKYEYKDTLNNINETMTWEKAKDEYTDVDNQAELFKLTQNLLILSIIIGVLFIIGALLAIVRISKKIAVIFGLLTLIICLSIPIYFMIQHPQAVSADMDEDHREGDGQHKSFMGSIKEEIEIVNIEVTTTWGPEAGWYFAWGGFVFSLLGFIFALALPKPEKTSKGTQTTIKKPAGSVVFKPLDDDDSVITSTAAKTGVKFETLGQAEDTNGKKQVKFEPVGIR